MNKKIRDHEYRIILILSDGNLLRRPVLLHDHAVQRQRLRHPLILLDAAVIMRIQISKPLILIERILLHINARRINVCAQDVHARRNRLLPEAEKRQHLLHAHRIYLISRFQALSHCHHLIQVPVAGLLRHTDAELHALPLRLAGIKAGFISFTDLFKLFQLLAVVRTPCTFSIHF